MDAPEGKGDPPRPGRVGERRNVRGPERLTRFAARLDISVDELQFDLEAIGYPCSRIDIVSLRKQLEVEGYRARVADGEITTPRPTFPTRAQEQATSKAAWEASRAAAARPLRTADAANLIEVRRSTLRQWVARGHLTPIGRDGPHNLYDRTDLFRARDEVRARTRRTPGLRTAQVQAKDFDRLVSVDTAAAIVRRSPSTIRMWVHRGHLQPAERRGHQHLYRVLDVIRAARR